MKYFVSKNEVFRLRPIDVTYCISVLKCQALHKHDKYNKQSNIYIYIYIYIYISVVTKLRETRKWSNGKSLV